MATDKRFGNFRRCDSRRLLGLLKSFSGQGHPKTSLRGNTVLIPRQSDLKFHPDCNHPLTPLDVDFQSFNGSMFPAIVWDIS
jgi:hypothetical protein